MQRRSVPRLRRAGSFLTGRFAYPCNEDHCPHRLQGLQIRTFSASYKKLDRYDRYRGSATPETLAEIHEESKKALETIRSTGMYQQVFQEIHEAAAKNERQINRERSLGPTGRYLYQWVEGDEGGRVYQRESVQDGPQSPNVLLSLNWRREELLDMSLSADETLLACVVTAVVSGSTQIKILHIASGREVLLGFGMERKVIAVEFGGAKMHHASHQLFLTAVNSDGRPNQVLCANIDAEGNVMAALPLRILHVSPDAKVHVDVRRTKGCEFVAINARSQSSNEVYIVGPTSDDLMLVRQREDGVQYHVDVGKDGDLFLMVHADLAVTRHDHEYKLPSDFLLYETSLSTLPLRNWFGKLRAGACQSHALSDFDIFEDYLVLYEKSRFDGLQRIRVSNRRIDCKDWTVPISENLTQSAVLSPGGNMYYGAKAVSFKIESPSMPRQELQCHLSNRSLTTTTPQETPDRQIQHQRILVTSDDGSQVPLSVVSRIDCFVTKSNEPARVLLIGYGAYGEPTSLAYDPTFQPLLDRGVALAFAHTRGGSELGQSWHLGGRNLNKPRAIEDFIACARALVSGTIFSGPVLLAARGFSAGGVIVGASINRRPDLFRCVALTNAFLDVESTLCNVSLPLTEHEWDEYGNPMKDEKALSTIKSYCPVHNMDGTGVSSVSMLLTAALDDDKVPFWNSLVYRKKCLDSSEVSDISLYVEVRGGHHFGANRLRVAALEATFLLSKLN